MLLRSCLGLEKTLVLPALAGGLGDFAAPSAAAAEQEGRRMVSVDDCALPAGSSSPALASRICLANAFIAALQMGQRPGASPAAGQINDPVAFRLARSIMPHLVEALLDSAASSSSSPSSPSLSPSDPAAASGPPMRAAALRLLFLSLHTLQAGMAGAAAAVGGRSAESGGESSASRTSRPASPAAYDDHGINTALLNHAIEATTRHISAKEEASEVRFAAVKALGMVFAFQQRAATVVSGGGAGSGAGGGAGGGRRGALLVDPGVLLRAKAALQGVANLDSLQDARRLAANLLREMSG